MKPDLTLALDDLQSAYDAIRVIVDDWNEDDDMNDWPAWADSLYYMVETASEDISRVVGSIESFADDEDQGHATYDMIGVHDADEDLDE